MPVISSVFRTDTPETIRRDLEIIKRELPVDIMEFFILTPLPGSRDHQRLVEEWAALDPDLNNYDTQHVTMDHPRMTRAQWQAIYRESWDLYYSDDHVATVLRRARVWGHDPKAMLAKLFAFHAPVVFEKMHPLEGGLIRRKYRRDRRPGFAIESPLTFYPRLIREFVTKYAGAYAMNRHYKRILAEVMADPRPLDYRDLAIMPVSEGDETSLAIFTATDSARTFVRKRRELTARREKA